MSLQLHVSRASSLDVGESVVSIVARAWRVLGTKEAPVVATEPSSVHVSKFASLHKQGRSIALPCLFHLGNLLNWFVLSVEELISEGLELHVLEHCGDVLTTALFGDLLYSNPLIIWIDFVIFLEKRIGVNRWFLARLRAKEQVVASERLKRVHHRLAYEVDRVFAFFLEHGSRR